MSNMLKPYKEYKNSDAEYIGNYPSHWTTSKMRYVFEERKEKNNGSKTDNILSVMKNRGVIPYSEKGNVGNKHSDDIERYNLVYENDIVMNCMNVIIGSVGRSKYFGTLSPVYYVFKNRDFEKNNVEYYEYVFSMTSLQRELTKYGKGILAHRMRVPIEMLKNLELPSPPVEEQGQIVRYLKYKITKINKFISLKKKLISTIREQKQALINEAVTKGLDSYPKMKAIGFEWLNKIPEHWKMCKLKQVAKIQTGLTLGKNYDSRNLVEMPYIRVANVQDGHLVLDKVTTVSVPVEEIASKTLQPGDVLMTEGGDRDKLGRGCVWNGEITPCLHQNHIFAVRTNKEKLLPEFLTAILTSQIGRIYFDLTAKKTTNLASTNSTTLKAFAFGIPDIQEQYAIIEALNEKTNTLNLLIEKYEKEIELIEEYRKRLISDVVTGKIDVREVEVNEIIEENSESFDADEELVIDEVVDSEECEV